MGGVKRLGGISHKATKTVFKERLAGRLNIAAKALEGKDYLMGKTFTVADAYLYTVLRWSPRMNVDLSP
ncbi:MAG: glutathione binding-like protein [Gallionella sp.]